MRTKGDGGQIFCLFERMYFMDGLFHKKLESVQYNAALAMTGAIQGTTTESFIKN